MLRKCLLKLWKGNSVQLCVSIQEQLSHRHSQKRNIGFYAARFASSKDINPKSVMVFKDFDQRTDKTKNSYLEMIRLYESRHPHRRGHVEFIYAAMRNMEEFGVERDLQVYKNLIDVMPKGKMVATNLFQVEFMHYPKQQQCIIDLLEKMEDNGVIPDADMEAMLINIFGNKAFPLRKYWRMMYWMPKFKNKSPWLVPNPPPDDAMQLARLAIERITSVDLRTEIDDYHADDVEDSIDKTWIVSGISPVQIELLNSHPVGEPVIVEAGSRVWMRRLCVNYFVLKSDAKPMVAPPERDIDDVSNIEIPFFNKTAPEVKPAPVKTVHEQDDGNIFGVCATGTSSKDSALSWVRLLQRQKAPILEHTPILFRFRKPSGDVVPYSEALQTQDNNQ